MISLAECERIGYEIAMKTLRTVLKNSQESNLGDFVDIEVYECSIKHRIQELLEDKYEDMKLHPKSFAAFIELSSITIVVILMQFVIIDLTLEDFIYLAELSHTPMSIETMRNVIYKSFGTSFPVCRSFMDKYITPRQAL